MLIKKFFLSLGFSFALAAGVLAQPVKSEPGLAVTFTAGAASDTVVTPNVQLYVPAGQSPSVWLAPGNFTATWSGFIAVDLRGDYLFRVETRGAVKVELGTNTIIEFTGDGAKPSEPTKPIRLSKGQNALKVTYTSPTAGDASVRLFWSEKGSLWEPINLGLLSHAAANDALAKQNQRRLRRDLVFTGRCTKCHALAGKGSAPELKQDAPSFVGIGARRQRLSAPWARDLGWAGQRGGASRLDGSAGSRCALSA